MRFLLAFLILVGEYAFAQIPVDQTRFVPLGISLYAPIASQHADEKAVHGFELNLLYGHGHGLSGAAIAGGVNRWDANVSGAGLAGLANWTDTDLHGAFLAPYNKVGGELQGTQIGLVNDAAKVGWGAQIALFNSSGDTTGAQIGWVNQSEDITGAQVGLVNLAGNMRGLQIGLVNVASKNRFGQVGILNLSLVNAFRFYVGAGNASQGEFGLHSGSGLFFGTVAVSSRDRSDRRFENDMSLVLGTGLQTSFYRARLSVALETTAAGQDRKPFSVPLRASVPIVQGLEAFAQWGPGLEDNWALKQYDTLFGLQYMIKGETFSLPM